MKWVDSVDVEGTDPPVKIGRPLVRDRRTGQEKPGRFYHERYTVGGRQMSKSLGTGNRKEAIRRVIERQESLRRGETTKANRILSLDEALDEWVTVCRNRGLSPKTLEKYDLVRRELQASLGERGHQPVSYFAERHFWAYRQYMVDAGHEPKTQHDRLTIVKQAFNYFARNGLVAASPLKVISLKRPESKPQPVFTAEQFQMILRKAHEYERPMFAFMGYTGARYGELRDVTWSDLLLARGSGFVRISKGGSGETTKDKDSRVIPLRPELREMLEKLPRRSDRIFTGLPCRNYPAGDGPVDQKHLLRRLKNVCKRCGFDNPKQYKLHTYRHTFASLCASANVPYKYALSWLGLHEAKLACEQTGEPARQFTDLDYRTQKSWSRSRRVVAKAEHLPGERGQNPRFVVTSIGAEQIAAPNLYEKLYCARGDMENRIKEQQLGLFADRTSCQTMRANQVRLAMSTVAYTLMAALRRRGLAGTPMAGAQCSTIRVRLLKIGARVRVTARKIWVSLSQSYPLQDLFHAIHARLTAPPLAMGP